MKLNSALLLIAMLAMCGCGESGKSEVKGTVKLDGEPVAEGQISFIITGSGASGGGNITNGNYTAQVPSGKAKVQINASKKMPLPPGEKNMYGETEEVRQYIPEKYNAKTELTADITGANPALNFDLKSK